MEHNTNGKEVRSHRSRRSALHEVPQTDWLAHAREHTLFEHQSGNVIIRVFAHGLVGGGLSYKADLVRAYSTPAREGEACSLEVRDYSDAIRCVKQGSAWYEQQRRAPVHPYGPRPDRDHVVVPTFEGRRVPPLDVLSLRWREHPRENEVAAHQSNWVLCRVYSNERRDGHVVHKAELVRLYQLPLGDAETFPLEVTDLPDAGRCLRWAQDWYWREERRLAKQRNQKWT